MLQIPEWLSISSRLVYRFISWYPGFFVGAFLWMIALSLYEPAETFTILPTTSYLFVLTLFSILLAIFLTCVLKKVARKPFSADRERFFQTICIALCCSNILIIPAAYQYRDRITVENQFQDHCIISKSRIRGTVQNRVLTEFYGKPTWHITIKVLDIQIAQKPFDSLEKLFLGKLYRIRSSPPSQVECGSIFEMSADIKIDKNGPKSWRIAVKPQWKTVAILGKNRFQHHFGEMRLLLLSHLQKLSFQLYPENDRIRNILFSLLFGFPLEKDIKADIHRTGVDHLFTVSGFHFNCVSGSAAILLFACSARLRALGSCISSLLFLFVVGLEAPSILRSWGTIGLGCMAILFGRHAPSIHVFGLALGFIALCDPSFVFSTGFQLSFLATWGILLYSVPIEGLFSRNIFIKRGRMQIEEMDVIDQIFYGVLRLFSTVTSLAISVWIFIIPYSFAFLDGFTPFAFIYNLLLPSLFSIALISGLFSVIGAGIFLGLGSFFAFFTKIWVKIGLFFIDASEGAFLFLPISFLAYISKKEVGLFSFFLLSVVGIPLHAFLKEKALLALEERKNILFKNR
ncbi:MAG: ComEC/Rec2 family competence protein [Chlamydia sp.]